MCPCRQEPNLGVTITSALKKKADHTHLQQWLDVSRNQICLSTAQFSRVLWNVQVLSCISSPKYCVVEGIQHTPVYFLVVWVRFTLPAREPSNAIFAHAVALHWSTTWTQHVCSALGPSEYPLKGYVSGCIQRQAFVTFKYSQSRGHTKKPKISGCPDYMGGIGPWRCFAHSWQTEWCGI